MLGLSAPMKWMQYGSSAFEIGNQCNAVDKFQVAHSLSLLNRYTGHTKAPYSVARHSYYVSLLCGNEAGAVAAMYGLMHDVHETVINDVSTPVKKSLSQAAAAEIESIANSVDSCIYKALGVPWPVPKGFKEIVKKADLVMLATEKRELMHECARDWDLPYEAAPRNVLVVEATPNWKVDVLLWLHQFERLQDVIAHQGGYPNV